MPPDVKRCAAKRSKPFDPGSLDQNYSPRVDAYAVIVPVQAACILVGLVAPHLEIIGPVRLLQISQQNIMQVATIAPAEAHATTNSAAGALATATGGSSYWSRT
jgi:hypothetical protein